MEESLKQVIKETFASKKQQRFFFAKAGDKSETKKERKKWEKWARDYAKKTNFKKLPEKTEEGEGEVDEIVDQDGNIIKGSIPSDSKSRQTSSLKTSDDHARAVGGQMGGAGLDGGGNAARLMRYFGEEDMSGALGYGETLGNDEDYEDAKEYFEDELDIPEDEAEDRLDQMGYIENAPKGVVRLVENPKKYVEDYVESVLSKRSNVNDVVEKDNGQVEVNPIIKRQIDTLKQTLKDNGISIKQLVSQLKNNE